MMPPLPSSLASDALARATAIRPFQDCLNLLPSAGARKAAILEACCQGLLSRDDTQWLFDVYDLATA